MFFKQQINSKFDKFMFVCLFVWWFLYKSRDDSFAGLSMVAPCVLRRQFRHNRLTGRGGVGEGAHSVV